MELSCSNLLPRRSQKKELKPALATSGLYHAFIGFSMILFMKQITQPSSWAKGNFNNNNLCSKTYQSDALSVIIHVSVLCMNEQKATHAASSVLWSHSHQFYLFYGFQVERVPKKHLVQEFEEFDYSDYDDISVSTVTAGPNVTEYEVRQQQKLNFICLCLPHHDCLCVCLLDRS